jgi:hypothetical protein
MLSTVNSIEIYRSNKFESERLRTIPKVSDPNRESVLNFTDVIRLDRKPEVNGLGSALTI